MTYPPHGPFTLIADAGDSGLRLDLLLAARLPRCTRSAVARMIRDRRLTVNGRSTKAGYRVRPGDRISGSRPPPRLPSHEPEPIAFDLLHLDRHIAVVNKPPGLVVHPAPGHPGGTLVNGLLHRFPELREPDGPQRAGIVHRLDKDTSGVLVVARTDAARRHLAAQFKGRMVRKTYLALVLGRMPAQQGKIALPLGRHPVERKKMSVHSRKPRRALTRWEVREHCGAASLLRVEIETGRTHQIRVHLAAVGHPVLGDPVYGRRRTAAGLEIPRQMLHARRLAFIHPGNRQPVRFVAPLFEDMSRILERLREESHGCCAHGHPR
jgi:23S rRNA pseudouridine1911/1915/1917 synthase